jgi:hypothetical protein
MLSNANIWPMFWLTIGGAMLVTAALCLLVATFSPAWFRPHRRHQPALTPVGRPERQAGHDHPARRDAEAA